ncbi:MAG TPA: hypothetical protein VFZ83_07205 [Acidimicrobiia bacterium]|nr:hypothetical protein [Acidimicrobiia bacterium]
MARAPEPGTGTEVVVDPRAEPEALQGEHELEADIDDVTAVLWERRDPSGRTASARRRLTEAVDGLLDAIARSVTERPLDVRDVDDAIERIEELSSGVSNRAGSAWSLWAMSRARRLLAGRWRIVPNAAVLAGVTSLLTSVACGAIELRVLGSLLVRRLQAEGRVVDERSVRRIVIGAYLDPDDVTTDVAPNATVGLRLLGRWARHAFPVFHGGRSLDRTRRAARAIDELDLSTFPAE